MPLDAIRQTHSRTPELRPDEDSPGAGPPPVDKGAQDLDAALDELAQQCRVDPRERLRPSTPAPEPPATLGERLLEWLLGPADQCPVRPDAAASSPTTAAGSRAPDTGAVPGPRGSDGRYTPDPAEVPARRTRVQPQELQSALRQLWPALSERGAQVLVAQSAVETGNWHNCYNYNLGNTKAPDARKRQVPHMYLLHVYEPGTRKKLDAEWGRFGSIVSKDPNPAHQKAMPAGTMAIEYAPPHTQAIFRAYSSLEEGISAWCNGMMARANKDESLLPALNRGDTREVARALARQHYFGADPAYYALALRSKLTELFGG